MNFLKAIAPTTVIFGASLREIDFVEVAGTSEAGPILGFAYDGFPIS
jgi:hypothetical protein